MLSPVLQSRTWHLTNTHIHTYIYIYIYVIFMFMLHIQIFCHCIKTCIFTYKFSDFAPKRSIAKAFPPKKSIAKAPTSAAPSGFGYDPKPSGPSKPQPEGNQWLISPDHKASYFGTLGGGSRLTSHDDVIHSSSSSLYIWNQGSSLVTWYIGLPGSKRFQIYRELEDEG